MTYERVPDECKVQAGGVGGEESKVDVEHIVIREIFYKLPLLLNNVIVNCSMINLSVVFYYYSNKLA